MLRDYQQRAIDDLHDYLEKYDGNPCLVLPTGSGKSHIVAEICRHSVQTWPETRILMLTHVKELIEQNAGKMLDAWPSAPLGIYSAGLKQRNFDSITFAGIQSVRDRADEIGHIDLIIVDECHLINHGAEGGYRKLIDQLTKVNPYLRVIGFARRVGDHREHGDEQRTEHAEERDVSEQPEREGDLQQPAEEGDTRAELVRELEQPERVAQPQPGDHGQHEQVEEVEHAERAELAAHALFPAALLIAPPRLRLGQLHLQVDTPRDQHRDGARLEGRRARLGDRGGEDRREHRAELDDALRVQVAREGAPLALDDVEHQRRLEQLLALVSDDELLDRGRLAVLVGDLERLLVLQRQDDPVEGEPEEVVAPPAVLEAALLLEQVQRELGQELDRARERRAARLVAG